MSLDEESNLLIQRRPVLGPRSSALDVSRMRQILLDLQMVLLLGCRPSGARFSYIFARLWCNPSRHSLDGWHEVGIGGQAGSLTWPALLFIPSSPPERRREKSELVSSNHTGDERYDLTGLYLVSWWVVFRGRVLYIYFDMIHVQSISRFDLSSWMARSLPLAEGWYVYLSILVGLPYLPLEHYSLSSAFVAWIDG